MTDQERIEALERRVEALEAYIEDIEKASAEAIRKTVDEVYG